MTHKAVHSRNPGKVNPSSSWILRKWQAEFCFKASQLQSFFNKLYWLCACVYTCRHRKMSKDNLWKMGSSFYHVGSGDPTQTVKLGGGHQPSVICLRSFVTPQNCHGPYVPLSCEKGYRSISCSLGYWVITFL